MYLTGAELSGLRPSTMTPRPRVTGAGLGVARAWLAGGCKEALVADSIDLHRELLAKGAADTVVTELARSISQQEVC